MKPDLFNVPDRILILLEGWTVEDLAIAKIANLTKIRGIGLATAKGIIEAAKGKLAGQKKSQEVSWKIERKQLRKRITDQEYLMAVQQVTRQEPDAISVRIKRIREANA